MKDPIHRIRWEILSKWQRFRKALTARKRKRERLRHAESIERKFLSLSIEEQNNWAQIPRQMHVSDNMFDGDLQHYLRCGEEAARFVKATLTRVSTDVKILDFPCGYGRVTRHLHAQIPKATLYGSELLSVASDFCATHFGMKVLPTALDFSTLTYNDRFDAIWCGSLLTHLDEETSIKLISFLLRNLSEKGNLLITSHGERVCHNMRHGVSYGLTPTSIAALLTAYENGYFAYADYPNHPGYGISITPIDWMRKFLAAQFPDMLVEVIPAGWDSHQDVWHIYRKFHP